MNFQNFWTLLQDELNQQKEFTIKRKKKFKAYLKYNTHREPVVYITPKLGKIIDQISYNEFKGIWNNAKNSTRETRFINSGNRLNSYQKKVEWVNLFRCHILSN